MKLLWVRSAKGSLNRAGEGYVGEYVVANGWRKFNRFFVVQYKRYDGRNIVSGLEVPNIENILQFPDSIPYVQSNKHAIGIEYRGIV